MGYLKDTNCYLSGAIESDDPNNSWRVEPKEELLRRFKIKIYDPNADPKQGASQELKEAKEKGDWKTVARIAKDFVSKDLNVIDRSDFLIANITYREEDGGGRYHLHQVPTTGTVHEIVNSDLYKKPTLIVCKYGLKYIPSWYFGIIDQQYLFGSWDDCYTYLKEVDEGRHKYNRRWNFVYKLI